MQAFIDWLLTTDPQRRIRLQLSGIATLLMLACVAVLNLLASSAGAQPLAIYVWTFFALGGLVTFFCSYAAVIQNAGKIPPWR